jgi:hypothetical protein
MARLAPTVVAGLPRHVTQRGNRREAIFFEAGDQGVYRKRPVVTDAESTASTGTGGNISCPALEWV